MNENSSIYVTCPGCTETTLILRTGPAVRCAGCGFDYGDLAKDRARFESFLVDRMREGVAGQLGAIAVHTWVSGLGGEERVREFRAIAEKNGVVLPAPADPDAFVRRILVGVGIFVAVLASVLTYLVVTS